MLLLYVQFSNIVRQFGIIIYRNIFQIKLSPFKKKQFASYSRLREACHTYLLFFYAELPSLQQRRQTLAKELFAEICKPTSCLHYLHPPPREPNLLTRLRNPRKYATPDGRTKNTSLLLIILLSGTISKTML